MSLTTPRAKGAIALGIALTFAIVSVLYAAPRAGAASQNEIVMANLFDGTALNGPRVDYTPCLPETDPEDGAGKGLHTAGYDCWPQNNVVRTYDLFAVRVDWDVNEADSTATTITVTLKPGSVEGSNVEWAPDKLTGLVPGCLKGSTVSDDGLVLTCLIGDQKQGSHGVVRPVARLKNGLNNSTFTVSSTMTDSSGATPVNAKPVTYWVSEKPTGNWVKNPPLLTQDPILDPGTNKEGYLFFFPVGLQVESQKASPQRGAGPIKTTTPIKFFDHAWDVAKDGKTSLATSTQIAAAKAAGLNVNGDACGMYDARNAGKFPVTQGTFTCGDVTSPNGYPVFEVTIDGYSGEAPANNADGTANSSAYTIMGQIIMWMDKEQVQGEMVNQAVQYANTISANPASDNVDPTKTDPLPIQIIGTDSTVPEKGVIDNTADFAVTIGEIGGGGGGPSNHFTHYGIFTRPGLWLNRYKSDGAVQRRTSEGKPIDSPNWFDGKGTVSRGEPVLLNLFVDTVGSKIGKEEPIQGCMRWDPTQVYLAPMGNANGELDVWNNDEATGNITYTTKKPYNKFGDLLYGTQQGAYYRGKSQTPAFVDLPKEVQDQLDIHVEYGYETGTSTWSDGVAQNATECNNASGRVWVDGADTAGLEKRKRADGTYGFDMVRVRIDGPFPWVTDQSPGQVNGNTWYNGPHGTAGFMLTVSGRVGTSLTVNPNGKSVYLHTSRAHGEWDPTKGQPPTTDCIPYIYSNDVVLNKDPKPTTYGWCSQKYNPGNENKAAEWTLDESSFTYTDSVRDSDSDRVTIVSARPNVVKTNDAGVMDIADNGQLVQFTLDLSAIGSKYEALTKAVFTDYLPPEYTFVSLDKGPSTPGASCVTPQPDKTTGITPPGGTITCTLSQQDPAKPDGSALPIGLPGDTWKDQIKVTVLVKGAVANPNKYRGLTNTAVLNTGGLTPWDPETGKPTANSSPFDAEQESKATAASYLPLASDEAAIIKAVDKGLGGCTAMPDGPALTGEALLAWQSRCSMIGLDPDDSNGDTPDKVGNMKFKLTYTNTGNSKLSNVRLVDVLPFIGDGKLEPPSNSALDGADPSTVGDARSPASKFSGKIGLVGVDGATSLWVTNADPSTVSRDPDAAINQATWCKASDADPNVWEYAAGPQGDCPSSAFNVTAVYVGMPDVYPDYDVSIDITLDTEGADCNDIWTNTYGLRANDIKLPVRSNDVSVMAGCQSVGDFAWLDTNRNGLQDNGEPAIPDVTVNLYDANDKLVDTTKTDATGYYSFQKLAPSTTYTIEFVPVDDTMYFTKQDASGDTSNSVTDNTDPPLAGTQEAAKVHGDSDADPTTGKVTFTTAATIGANLVSSPTAGTVADNPGLDAGFVTAPVSIGDYVWIDANRDGQQDPSEPAVPGVTVNLYAADGKTLVATTTTDANGYYAFADLFGGLDYVIEFVPPTGATFTVQNQGPDVSDSDADPKTGRVNVTAPIKGKNLIAPGKTDDPTNDAGFVQLNLVLEKEITSPAPFVPGTEVSFELTPSNEGPADALPGWSVTDLLPVGLTYVSASGEGYTCEPGQDDVGDTVTCTAANGLVAGATGAPITVTATIQGYFVGQLHNVAYVSPDSKEIPETNPLVVPTRETETDKTPTDNDAEAVLSVNPVSVGDYVWWDVNRDGLQQDNEPAIPNITVKIYLPDGTEIGSTTTDENGFYSFTDLAPGSDYGIVFFNPDGTYFTLQTVGDDRSIDSNPDDTGYTPVRTPDDGNNSATEPDDPTYDAGLIQLNLTLTKELVTPDQVEVDDTVVFNLIPHNDGPVDALAGWSVTDLMPAQLGFVSASGDGYTCSTSVDETGTSVTCVSSAPLLAGADGPTITITATVAVDENAAIHNVAYVTPDDKDIPETIPLEVPDRSTDTDITPTDNDSQADLELVGQLTDTGGLGKVAVPMGLLLILVAGGVLLLGRRRLSLV